jgi:hypothetical protein
MVTASEQKANGTESSTENPLAAYSNLCGNLSWPPAGIYQGPGGAFVESNSGRLYWCTLGTSTLIAHAARGSLGDFFGMGGVKTNLGVVLVLDSLGDLTHPPGFWFCLGATSSGCNIQSSYTTLPSSFCSAQTQGHCEPFGIALDKNLNVYYADPDNGEVVECTYASKYQACSNLWPVSFAYGVFKDSNGDLWAVQGGGCNGTVYKNGVMQYSVGDNLYAITISSSNPSKTPHVYVTDSHGCMPGDAGILDSTDGKALPTPITGGQLVLYGLDSKLQFTDFNGGHAYSVKDKS